MFQKQAIFLRRLTDRYIGMDLTDLQVAQFCNYGNLLLDWNQRLNLTRITEPQEVIRKHFVDSMVLAKYITGERFADLGTGAGFPGIPLKILLPELEVVLVDSLRKRLTFLDTMIKALPLQGIKTVHARMEDLGRDPLYRASFDTVAARAVARLPVLLEYALPLLKQSGLFLAPKGAQVKAELADSKKALKQLGGSVDRVEQFTLGEGAEYRVIVVIKKTEQTPEEYPRRAGVPEKNPLI